MTADDLKGLSDQKLQFILDHGDESGQLVPLARQALKERQGGIKSVPPTGERAAKLERDIAASQSPLPGGQWAQPVERALRYAGVIGGGDTESVPQSVLHQANAGTASMLSNVPGLMQGAEALGDLSDALVPGQDPRHNILPRSGGTRQLIASAPSPLLAETQGIAPWAPAGKAGMAAEAAQSLTAPVQTVAKAMPGVQRLPGTVLPAVATQVGLNTALNSAATAGKVLGGQDADVVNDIVKPSLAPESLAQAAALGSLPTGGAGRTKSQRQAETYAQVRKRGGGQIPSEIDRPAEDVKRSAEAGVAEARAEGDRQVDEFNQQATERKRTFADKAKEAMQAATDTWRIRREKLAAAGQDDIAVAKKSDEDAIAQAGAEQEEPARRLYTDEREAWMGKGGKGGIYRAKLDEIMASSERGESGTIADTLRQTAAKYQPTSEPEAGSDVQASPESRTLSLGKGVNALVESVIGHLGENPSLREYQNALREVDVAAERHKGEPSARQAFTEVAAKLRQDAYRQFPKFAELAGQNREQMGRLETVDQALYGKEDPRIGEGSSGANRFAGETADGEPVKVPMASTTKASRWLAGEGEDPTTAHTYEAFRKLGKPYQRILDVIQSVKDQARGHVADVTTDVEAQNADLEGRALRSQRNIARSQQGRERAMTDELAGQKSQLEERRQESIDDAKIRGRRMVDENAAVEAAKFPDLMKLVPSAALVAGGSAYHGRHSLPMVAAGLAHGAKLMAPYVRSRVAYYTPEALKVDPELMRTGMLPALSGPLAFEGSDPFAAMSKADEKLEDLERTIKNLIAAGVSPREARRVATEATREERR